MSEEVLGSVSISANLKLPVITTGGTLMWIEGNLGCDALDSTFF